MSEAAQAVEPAKHPGRDLGCVDGVKSAAAQFVGRFEVVAANRVGDQLAHRDVTSGRHDGVAEQRWQHDPHGDAEQRGEHALHPPATDGPAPGDEQPTCPQRSLLAGPDPVDGSEALADVPLERNRHRDLASRVHGEARKPGTGG